MFPLNVTIMPEQWDSKSNEFIPPKVKTLRLEHSLVSLSKWESKWHKPFLSTPEMTFEETLDYIKFMTLTQNVDPDVYLCLTDENIQQIKDYIYAPMTATTFSDDKGGKKSRKIITSELIYCWMIELGIPFECQKWHLNRLITLIRVCKIENAPPKKMSKSEAASRQAQLNAARRKQLHRKG